MNSSRIFFKSFPLFLGIIFCEIIEAERYFRSSCLPNNRLGKRVRKSNLIRSLRENRETIELRENMEESRNRYMKRKFICPEIKMKSCEKKNFIFEEKKLWVGDAA